MSTLSDLGEQGLLRLLTATWKPDGRRVRVGVGDDCAVLRLGGDDLLFKTDAIVENVHFESSTPPALIGRKALARAVSDVAAMGGWPVAAVITLGLPRDESPARLRAIYGGLEQAAKIFGVQLVGGETTRARDLFLNVALIGEMRGRSPVLRSGARASDLIFVTGRLGGSRTGKHLKFTPRLAEGQWLAKHRFATAMMDLSDGLGADLPRLAEASALAFSVDDNRIPRARGASVEAAWNDGEDYELLFTIPPRRADSLKKRWPFATPVHCMGTMLARGSHPVASAHGFDHFKQRGSDPKIRGSLGRRSRGR